jgi:hypothetical protein
LLDRAFDDQGQRKHGDQRNRLEIFLRIVTEISDKMRQNGQFRRMSDQHGVAIGCCARHFARRSYSARARPVLDGDGLAQNGNELLRHQARDESTCAALCRGVDQLNRFGGIRLGKQYLAGEH